MKQVFSNVTVGCTKTKYIPLASINSCNLSTFDRYNDDDDDELLFKFVVSVRVNKTRVLET